MSSTPPMPMAICVAAGASSARLPGACRSVDTIDTRAVRLAEKLGLPFVGSVDPADIDPRYGLVIVVNNARLELRGIRSSCRRAGERDVPGPVYVDFVGGKLGYAQRVNRFGLLFRAVGLRPCPPTIIDATAGLGQDAFRLACSGCRVTAIERSPILGALIEDGIERALRVPQLADVLKDHLTLIVADAREFLTSLPRDRFPKVIYLDPMFPPKKKSALVKKEMRILRSLIGDDEDAGELLTIARQIAQTHVVVKRMHHAPPLAPAPTRTYQGKTTRYDIYARR